ncbi:RNA-binding S4 domain-containing protein [Paracoccus niistensis]|uniref:RNA-binding S4 domain-containing protein n=1 Tax=Paracoccus niistensis TaxID=632935 RepID=A0ABV6I4L3_9RHOB
MARKGRDRTPEVEDAPADSIRLDRWLCHARVFRTRTVAAERIAAGGVRINGAPCRKPGHEVKVGDVVTAAAPGGVRSLRVLSPGERRGPASEARALYEDLDAPELPDAPGA